MPTNPETTPVIYIAAGSGVAPFRGFIQERAQMLESKHRKLAPALLFFGCRAPDQDDLYREEFDKWESAGAVEVIRSFSRATDKSEGCKYVGDMMWKHRERLVQLWEDGAKLFVCGSRGVAESVKEVMIKIRLDAAAAAGSETDEEATRKWFEDQRNIRYVTDVFD